MKTLTYLFLAVLLGVVTLFTACSTSSTPTSLAIQSFAATPDSLEAGGEVTLSWEVTGATRLELDQGIGVVTGTSINVKVAENKTFTLTASNESDSVTKTASVTMTVASSLYVNPAEGDDASVGDKAQPFKTIKKALSVVKTGETIVLFAGTYSGASGETWDYTLPDAVTIKANSDGVVLVGNGQNTAFTLEGSGGLEYLSFQDFIIAVKVTTGEIALPGVKVKDSAVLLEGNPQVTLKDATFENTSLTASGESQISLENTLVQKGGLSLSGTSAATIKSSVFDGFSYSAVYLQDDAKATVEESEFKNGNYAFYVSNNSQLTMTGGSIHDLSSGDCGSGKGVYVVGYSGDTSIKKVLLENVFMNNIHGNALDISGPSNVTLKNADIRRSGQTGCGNSDNIEVTNLNAVLTLENSQISQSLATGLRMYSGQLVVKNTTFYNNPSGLSILNASASVESSTFQYGMTGLEFSGYAGASLTLRDNTFESNKTGIYTSGSINLGTSNNPGNNVFDGNSDHALYVSNSASSFTVYAVGNTWTANEQCADAQGHCSSQLLSGPQNGKNYYLSTVNQKIQF